MKLALFIWIVVITILSSLLFEFKHAVQDGWDRLDHLERDITIQRQALQVLRAEWSHLNQPDRLAWLAEKHLNLQPIQPRQILSWATFTSLFPTASNPELSFLQSQQDAKHPEGVSALPSMTPAQHPP